MHLTWPLVLICGWLAGTVSGVAGFGGALLLLPVLTFTVGAKAAIPILTISQLLGNLSRAGFGWRDIRWRPVLLFSAGAVPASVIGSRLFVGMPSPIILRLIGVLLLTLIAFRHLPLGKRPMPERLLVPSGGSVGFLSAIAGSAGPLGAAVFLSLRLPAKVYVASEAMTAVVVHLTKSITYGSYAALSLTDISRGIALGSFLVLGSWTGRELIDRIPEKELSWPIEALLAASALLLLLTDP